ncbi:hypothetical protein F2P81_005980 [Scophthalmus maximus]|uniref:Uncharacterized protein n=1 Tax=Scophthalmus maximus TaxID=52904 RepID=A0A6A4TDH5_SCOMX|nr:hypothetical protein F2P81_005980 [Scophthalmus maximus]
MHRMENVEDKGEQEEMRKAADEMLQDVLLNLPQRNHKNVQYIMNKLFKRENGWTSTGEFIYHGTTIKGSHMID